MGTKEVIDYVMDSPGNTNRAVLKGLLEDVAEGGSGGVADIPEIEVIYDYDNNTYPDIPGEVIEKLLSGDASPFVRLNLEYNEKGESNRYRATLNGLQGAEGYGDYYLMFYIDSFYELRVMAELQDSLQISHTTFNYGQAGSTFWISFYYDESKDSYVYES